MKFVIANFTEESNSFTPIVCDRKLFEAGIIAYGEDGLIKSGRTSCLKGMSDVLLEAGCERVCSAYFASGSSSGKVDRAVYDEFMGVLTEDIAKAGEIDGVLLNLHGATVLTDEDDAEGLMVETLRKLLGPEKIIGISVDFHAYITQKMVDNADIICGYLTYPHVDYYQVGQRTAQLAIEAVQKGKPHMGFVKLPMLHQAEACMTTGGPMKELETFAAKVKELYGLSDVTVFQMQPWLDVPEGGATVITIGYDEKKTKKAAEEISRFYFGLRKDISFKLYSIDEVLDIAEANKEHKPVILSDAADSPSAGATGDSTEVLKKLLDRNIKLYTMLAVTDKNVPAQAEKIGVGNEGTFTLGATFDPKLFQPITIKATVHSIHDGEFTFTGRPDGFKISTGKTVVLVCGSIYILVCETPCANYTPRLYTAFGLDPGAFDLVIVKSALQFRQGYGKYTDLMFNADTKGSASANLHLLDFKKLPRPMYPFDSMDNFALPEAFVK